MNDQTLKVGFQTFGCRSNYADTVELQAALVDRGHLPTGIENEADVYVINTCTVTDQADKEAFRLLKKLRKRSPNAKIVVTGCLAEVDAAGIAELGVVDAIHGPGNKDDLLAEVLGQARANKLDQVVTLPKKRSERLNAKKSISLETPISKAIQGPGTALGEINNRARYHLRVQEGCENFCTFCIIPESRGGYSSRQIKDILNDIKHLSSVGYEEIVLTGTHLGGYGIDRGNSFFELLKAIAGENPGPRIRISSIDPDDLSPEIIEFIAKSNVFCEHLHICVQAFSDSILKRMRRKHSLADIFQIISYIGEHIPNCGLGSDLITGFPGESRADVDQAMQHFLELPFSYLHVFPYSEREGTAATMLDGVVEPSERKRRAARFRAIAQRKKEDFAIKLIGKDLEIIAETADHQFVYGTSREFVSCSFKIDSSLSPESTIGKRFVLNAQSFDKTTGCLLCQ